MMRQINITKAVVTAIFFTISLLGLITGVEAHDGNVSATDVHACVHNANGMTRIVSVNAACKNTESTTHWAIVGPAGADADQGQIDALQALVDTFHPVFAIGDTGPAGGIVFEITIDGLNGLEAAPVDQASAQWCASSIDIANVDNIGAAATPDSHSGAHNTPLIEAVCGATSAAGIAANYVWLNGQTDGFLPNKEELNLLFIQRNVVDGFTDNTYWSSSENVANLAWAQNFINGFQVTDFKSSTNRVRAIRAF